MNEEKFIRYMREYIANIAIGPTTLRNQGKLVTKKARNFLIKEKTVDLSIFRKIKPSQYPKQLDRWTDLLRKKKIKWGTARKALNLFMIQAFMNKYLAKKYGMNKFRNVLETPLDSQASKFLRKKAEEAGRDKLPRWKGIKGLKQEDSACYQEFASDFSKREGIPRACLDILIWRQNMKNKKKSRRKK